MRHAVVKMVVPANLCEPSHFFLHKYPHYICISRPINSQPERYHYKDHTPSRQVDTFGFKIRNTRQDSKYVFERKKNSNNKIVTKFSAPKELLRKWIQSHFFRASHCQLSTRVARFFLAQHSKTGEIYQNYHKIYQMAIKYTKRQ
jgi:hypothetical protein